MVHWPPFSGPCSESSALFTFSFQPAPFPCGYVTVQVRTWSHCRGEGQHNGKLFYCFSVSQSKELLYFDERLGKLENHIQETVFSIRSYRFKL